MSAGSAPNFGKRGDGSSPAARHDAAAGRGAQGACQLPAMLRLVANIAGWFIVSIFLTLYNKLSVTTWGMDFPLTIACQHGQSAPLGSARGRPLRLLRARLAALAGSTHSQGEQGH